MNAGGFDYGSSGEVMEEIARLSPIYGGVSYQRLERETSLVLRSDPTSSFGIDQESPKPTQLLYTGRAHRGVQWPCASGDEPSTPILYSDGFPAGQAAAITPEFRLPEPLDDLEYPLSLVPGRVLLQRDRGMRIEKGRLNRIVRDESVELNPTDAPAWGIEEGDSVEISTRRGRLVGQARLDDTLPPGVVAFTGLFGQLAVDLQASEDMDPMAKVPGLDIAPARVIKLAAGPD